VRRSLIGDWVLAAGNSFNDAYPCNHCVHATREQAQHAHCIIRTRRLTEDGLIDYDNRIRRKHQILPPGAPNRECLLASESQRTLAGRLDGKRSFVDIRRLHRE
jgi:hypothetical protein